MNFLAHLYLSGSSDEIMVGNFITDFLTGESLPQTLKGIYRGILLHREIDFFADRHRQVKGSKKRLWQRHRHYSAVIVDIYYDHFLAKNWARYSDTSLEMFAEHAYATIERFAGVLPQRALRVLPHMIADNWLVNYRDMAGIDRALQGLARRASFPSLLDRAIEDLQMDYENFENDFNRFFPDLISHCLLYLEKNN